ncbi:hypothetical protein DSECCO2_634050 [anaerobic digester metagenome]
MLRRTEHQGVVLLLGEVFDRRHDREPEVFRDGTEVLAPVAVEEVPVEHDGAFGDGLALVRDDQVRIELHPEPEPVALLARAEGAVEGEHPGLEFLECNPADRAGHERRAGLLVAVLVDGDDEPFGLCKGVLDRLDES